MSDAALSVTALADSALLLQAKEVPLLQPASDCALAPSTVLRTDAPSVPAGCAGASLLGAANIAQQVSDELGVTDLVREKPLGLLIGPMAGMPASLVFSQFLGFWPTLLGAMCAMFAAWSLGLWLEWRRMSKAGAQLLNAAARCDDLLRRAWPEMPETTRTECVSLRANLIVVLTRHVGHPLMMEPQDRAFVSLTMADYLPKMLTTHHNCLISGVPLAAANAELCAQVRALNSSLLAVVQRSAASEVRTARGITRLLQSKAPGLVEPAP